MTGLQTITLHGHTVAYRTAGSGPVVALIHGMAGSSAAWRYVMPLLASRFTVVAPDLPGHGGSSVPGGDHSLSAHANVVRDLLTTLGHRRATVVGQSYGGGVAMQLAYQFPERCERLALVCSGGLGPEVSGLLRALSLPGSESVLSVACAPALQDVVRTVTGWLGGLGVRATPAVEEMWSAWTSLGDFAARRAFLATLRAVIDQRGQRVSAVDRLYLAHGMPTLIVWGERDRLIPPSHALATHAAIPGSRLALFPDAGHFPHCESPQRFADALAEFIDATTPAEFSEADIVRRLRGEATAVA
jgi:pimeloyl-ACP methyl ester carboxylesterase